MIDLNKMTHGEYRLWLHERGVTEEDVDEYGQLIGHAYETLRKARYPGYQLPSKYGTEFWRRVALSLWDLRPDPGVWVEAQASNMPTDFPPPTHVLGTPAALTAYEDFMRNSAEGPSAFLELRLFADYFVHLRKRFPARPIPELLEDPDAGFGPLFKWCVCHQISDKAGMQKVTGRALVQLAVGGRAEVYADKFPEAVGELRSIFGGTDGKA